METKTIVALGIVIALMLSASAFLWSANQYLSEGRVETTKDNEFYMTNAEMKTAFVSGCVESGGPGIKDFCECCFEYISSQTTDSELADMAIEFSRGSDEMSDLMHQLVRECLYLY